MTLFSSRPKKRRPCFHRGQKIGLPCKIAKQVFSLDQLFLYPNNWQRNRKDNRYHNDSQNCVGYQAGVSKKSPCTPFVFQFKCLFYPFNIFRHVQFIQCNPPKRLWSICSSMESIKRCMTFGLFANFSSTQSTANCLTLRMSSA